jgi:hypothetical protein
MSESVYQALVDAILKERVAALADAFAEMYVIAHAGTPYRVGKGIDEIAVLVLTEKANG